MCLDRKRESKSILSEWENEKNEGGCLLGLGFVHKEMD